MGQLSSTLRLGSTSYVYPDDVLRNVRRLAGMVQDVEWVVFEVIHGLPGPEVVAEMARLGQAYGHSYTVHLPLDLALASGVEAERRAAVEMTRRVMAAARPLDPWAYVVHMRGLESPGGVAEALQGPPSDPAWYDRAVCSLEALGRDAGGPERVAVENVPEYPAEWLWPLLERLPVSLCLDVGHLLRQGRDPWPVLDAHLGRSRAIHLHGFEAGRDHRSLAAMDQGMLLRLLRRLWQERYRGVVTIEVFAAQPFLESWELVEGLWRRAQE